MKVYTDQAQHLLSTELYNNHNNNNQDLPTAVHDEYLEHRGAVLQFHEYTHTHSIAGGWLSTGGIIPQTQMCIVQRHSELHNSSQTSS